MYETTFHSALLTARNDAKESLRALSARTGIATSRLTRLERGVFAPTARERRLLAAAFEHRRHKLLHGQSQPKALYRELKSTGLKHCGLLEPYLPPRDRSSRVRAAAAWLRYPPEMRGLTQIVRGRLDFKKVNAFCEKLSVGSALECLFVTDLLATGARPAYVAPYWLPPRTPLATVCPKTREQVGHRPFPVLIANNGVFVPQVSFLANRVYTVDFLRHFEGNWSVVEIDGRGHRDHGDAERGAVLGLSVLRLTESEVVEGVRRTLGLA